MEENLVGHLLGALDPVTHARVEAYLEVDPQAQYRLELLQGALEPLADDREDPAPPPALLMATFARIAEYQVAQNAAVVLPSAPRPSPRQIGSPGRWFRPIDWVTAAALLVLVGGLGLPLLARQWHEQKRLACGDNLRRFWVALGTYSDQCEGEFPRVEQNGARGVAGVFVPLLQDRGLLSDVSIACPATGQRPPSHCSLVELERLQREDPEAFTAAARDLAGNYAYSLGYMDGSRLLGLRRDSGDCLPILADCARRGGDTSDNHQGRGQNVLYIGGHVRWCVEPTVGVDADHIYVNQRYRVQAGISRVDSVLAASGTRPFESE